MIHNVDRVVLYGVVKQLVQLVHWAVPLLEIFKKNLEVRKIVNLNS